jgi:uracil-DNA glycosylase family 4
LWNSIASFGLQTLHIRRTTEEGGISKTGNHPGASPPALPPRAQGASAEAAMLRIREDVEGNPDSGILFVGEGPGATEDETGRPFVGKAGQLLDKILASIDIDRTKCYIANVVKCRPPANRIPAMEEIAACACILERQIDAISPRVIVALGASAASVLLDTRQGLASLRGTFHSRRGVPLLVTYHPAALLRTPALKRPVWDDMKRLLSFLGENSNDE